jgi:hypothetical protein
MIESMENWGEIIAMFSQAGATIKVIEQNADRAAIVAKGQYSIAESAWKKYDYNTTKTYLEKILTKNIETQNPSPSSASSNLPTTNTTGGPAEKPNKV